VLKLSTNPSKAKHKFKQKFKGWNSSSMVIKLIKHSLSINQATRIYAKHSSNKQKANNVFVLSSLSYIHLIYTHQQNITLLDTPYPPANPPIIRFAISTHLLVRTRVVLVQVLVREVATAGNIPTTPIPIASSITVLNKVYKCQDTNTVWAPVN
jgi:hypothetical protein